MYIKDKNDEANSDANNNKYDRNKRYWQITVLIINYYRYTVVK